MDRQIESNDPLTAEIESEVIGVTAVGEAGDLTTMEATSTIDAVTYFSNKLRFTTTPFEMHQKLENHQPMRVIDVRAKEDFDAGHVPGAISMPEDDWDDLSKLSREMENLLYCYSGHCHLAARAAVRFAQAGFSVREMEGGFTAWREEKYKIEPESHWPDAPKADDFTRARMSSHH